MKRLFYLVDHIDHVQDISDDLHARGVSDWRFHVVSKDEAGLYTHRLHRASVFDRTDLARYVERGMLIGLVLGLSFILPMALYSGLGWPTIAWVGLSVFAVMAGGWLGGFGGISAENYRIRRFHDAIEAGKYLVMVDVPKKFTEEVEQEMLEHHPEALLKAEGSSFNNPFASADGRVHLV
ncbi:hypothetical protein [Marinobacter mobilis]|uniref:NAD/FAD-utilizing enzyme apparently involved in cell division n=1 Tax=Marinobacter mobilis TaxID=488533 RepID=A0A1H2SVU9_9GAMM|nr:hypothetical protein [Marinobacter mobilis]SDW35803.1 hypothetical protein SAMN04487960_102258 [Marinobacter mobilis]